MHILSRPIIEKGSRDPEKRNVSGVQLIVGGPQVDRVSSFQYLGTIVTKIHSRIVQAGTVFSKMSKVLTSKQLVLDLRVRILRCHVLPVFFYGVETWTLTDSLCHRIHAFKIWTYRRFLKISWVDRVTNAEVLRRMDKSCEVMNTFNTVSSSTLDTL